MKRIIMQPCADKTAVRNYHKTIEGSIPLEDIKDYVSPKVFSDLKNIYPNGFIKVWGATPSKDPTKKNSKENTWRTIKSGDIALMAKKGKYFARAIVTYKLNSIELANYLWGSADNGDTWEYIYFVDQVSPIDIPYVDFNRAVDYADNRVPQGFGILTEEKSQAFLTAFNYVEYPNPPSPLLNINYDDIEDLIKYDKDGSLDAKALKSIRAEQASLRRVIFKTAITKCCICGKEYLKEMMVAAHVKKRAECSDEEKIDLSNIAAPMCRFGCDELYERGYIGVSDAGKISILKHEPTTTTMTDYLSSLEGNHCTSWNDNTKDYFAYHYNKHAPK